MSVALPIEEDPRFRRYTASAGQTVFSIPFPFQQAEDVSIQFFNDGKYTEIDRSTFSIAGAMNPSGGAVTFNAGRSAGDVIVVVGAAILERLSSIVRDGRFASKLTDDELDRNRIIQQEMRRDINRSIKAPYGSNTGNLLASYPSTLLNVDEEGNIIESETPANEKSLREAADKAIITIVENATFGSVAGIIPTETRSVMSALPDTPRKSAFVFGEDIRNGQFSFVSGDLSGLVSADPLKAVYVAPAVDPSGASGAWVREGEWLLEGFKLAWFLPPFPTPLQTSAAIQAMFDLGQFIGVKAFDFRGLTLEMSSNSIGTDEGTAVIYRSAYDGFHLDGRGCTIKPSSNKIELFAQYGSNASLEGFVFDNSDNGPLNNEVRPTSMTDMGGVAGRGNFANCVWRQYTGDGGLRVRDVETIGFHTDFEYYGDNTDNTNLCGILDVDNLVKRGGMFGVLCTKPEMLSLTRCKGFDIINSINGDGSATAQDPGHFLYLADRSGAYPKSVLVSQIQGEGGESTLVKVRSGENVVVSDISTNGGVSGIEIENVKSLTGGNFSIKLGGTSSSNQAGLWLIGAGNCELDNIFIDIRGQSQTWGVRGTDGVLTAEHYQKKGRLSNVTVVTDNTTTTLAQIILEGFEDWDLVNFKVINTGSVASSSRPIDIRTSNRIKIIDPQHVSPNGATNAAQLVTLNTCTDCVVAYHPAEALNVAPTGSTVGITGGSGNTVIQGRTIKDGRSSITLSSNGNADLTFDTPFKFACTAVVAGIQSGALNTAEVVYPQSNPGVDKVTVGVRPNPGAVSRVIHYIATGY